MQEGVRPGQFPDGNDMPIPKDLGDILSGIGETAEDSYKMEILRRVWEMNGLPLAGNGLGIILAKFAEIGNIVSLRKGFQNPDRKSVAFPRRKVKCLRERLSGKYFRPVVSRCIFYYSALFYL